jgi:16S rRNA (uracil1498-N3)-methyltransferase
VETARAGVRGARESGAARRAERWRRIALEAAKQSGRARVPEVAAPIGLDELFAAEPGRADARRVMFAERGGRGLAETVAAWGESTGEVVALVGPEGGWEDGEIEQALAAGWEAVTLGGRTLRAETACVVAVALLQHLCGDLR